MDEFSLMSPIQDVHGSSRLVLLLAWTVFPLLLAVPSSIPPVHAAGTLFVGPSQQGPVTVGTTITYQVNVTGMDPFDGWDVVVQADLSVLDPLSISVAGNVLGSVTQIANCVNGTGSGCSINDGAGGAHSAADSFSTPIGGSGLLFTITYKVVNDGFSYLRIPAGLDTIVNSGVAVAHSDSRPAVYGNPPFVPIADFTLSLSPPANITQGVDNVTFDGSPSSDPAGGTITRYAWEITALNGGPLDIRNSTSQPIWAHVFSGGLEVGVLSVQLIVTDNLGLSSAPVNRIITVLAPPDFSIFVYSTTLNIHPGHSATVGLIFQGRNNFVGDVTLSVSAPFGFSTSLSVNPVALSTTTSATSVLTVSAHVRPGFNYALTVTATSGALVRSITFSVVVSRPSQSNAPL